jgi:hypothetical protein
VRHAADAPELKNLHSFVLRAALLQLPQLFREFANGTIVDAVQRNRFEVWVPSSGWVGVKLGNLLGRAIRERMMLALGIAKVSGQADQSARRNYHERAFGGEH